MLGHNPKRHSCLTQLPSRAVTIDNDNKDEGEINRSALGFKLGNSNARTELKYQSGSGLTQLRDGRPKADF